MICHVIIIIISSHILLDAIRLIETEQIIVAELETEHKKIQEKIVKTQQLWEKMKKAREEYQRLAEDLMAE